MSVTVFLGYVIYQNKLTSMRNRSDNYNEIPLSQVLIPTIVCVAESSLEDTGTAGKEVLDVGAHQRRSYRKTGSL
jgi:hypothetical protein